MANTTPGFVTGQRPSADLWNSEFGDKADHTNGVLTTPSIINPTITGGMNVTGNVGVVGDLTVSGVVTQNRTELAYVPKTGIMIPFYIYPANPYSDVTVQRMLDLIRTYHDVPVIIVVNPSNGPGPVADGNYTAAIRMFKAAGATVCGYVSTAYGGPLAIGIPTDPSKTEAVVLADVLAWNTVYATTPVDGIFFDEMPYDPGPGNYLVPLYQRYYEYCHTHGYGTVIGNPGTNQQEIWYTSGTADIIVTWETSTPMSETDIHGNFEVGHVSYPYSDNAILEHTQPVFDIQHFRRMRRYCKWIYITDDIFLDIFLDNPWDSLATYLEELFAACADTNVPGDGLQLLTFNAAQTWDAQDIRGATVTLTADSTIAFPTNMITGGRYRLMVIQDVVGGWDLTFHASYKFPTGTTLPLTTAASGRHIVEFIYDGTYLYATSVEVYA